MAEKFVWSVKNGDLDKVKELVEQQVKLEHFVEMKGVKSQIFAQVQHWQKQTRRGCLALELD